MKILVTGSNGFLGTHLCLDLLKEGHEVIGLVRSKKSLDDNLLNHPHFHIKEGDLLLPDWVNSLPTDLEACIHTAGLVHSFSNNDFYKMNAMGTQNLIESLQIKFPTDFKFIFISSLAASGPSSSGILKAESSFDFPISHYGRSKKVAEEILKSMAPKSWKLIIIRPPMVIGPGDKAVLDIFKMVKSGFILLPGINSKRKEYSFVCVFDLVETIKKSLYAHEVGLFYSAHDSIIEFEDLIFEIQTQLKKAHIIYLPIPFFIVKFLASLLAFIHRYSARPERLTPDKISELKAMSWCCKNHLTKSVLKQNYQYDLGQTIKITLKDYQKRKWI